jgi:hypothetical protein
MGRKKLAIRIPLKRYSNSKILQKRNSAYIFDDLLLDYRLVRELGINIILHSFGANKNLSIGPSELLRSMVLVGIF